MTANEFNALCQAAGIDPALALENETIVNALKARSTVEQVKEILNDEF